MPLYRVKTWGTDESPTAADLNAEFDNIIGKFSANITAGDIADDVLEVDATLINATSYDTIQDAINAALSAGKNVFIPPGTYSSDTRTIEVPANVVIKGAGASLVTIRPASNFLQSAFIRFTGTNSGMEGVTIDCFNLHTNNYGIRMVEVDTQEEAQVYLSRCRFTQSSIYAADITMLYIATSSASRDGVRVTDCEFEGLNNTGNVYGIRVPTTYRLIIDRCRFKDLKTRSIWIENGFHVRVSHCRWERTDEAYSNLVYARGLLLFENNVFLSICDFSIANQGAYVYLESYISTLVILRTCQFSYSGIITENPLYAARLKGNVAAETNYGAAGTAGFDFGFIFYDSISQGQNHAHVRCNVVNTGPLYAADGSEIYSDQFDKEYNGRKMFSLDDVFMWMTFTGTTNYLRFKQGTAPSNALDDHARIALTGTTNIAD